LDPGEAQHWAAAFVDAWILLVRYHRRMASEVRTIITTLTPLHRAELYTSNATSRATFGCVALSRPSDGRALALALIHEVQHAKLAALSDLVELVRPNTQELYYAPWRDDPRPAEALLHGTYAHLGVAEFWRKQRYIDAGRKGNLLAHAEYVRWRDAAAEAANTLRQCPDLTPLGHDFVNGIHETLRIWRRDHVPRAAAELARTAAESHRLQWSRGGNQAGGGSKSKSSRLPSRAARVAGWRLPSVFAYRSSASERN
jgi:HEXXH motif-containing protein